MLRPLAGILLGLAVGLSWLFVTSFIVPVVVDRPPVSGAHWDGYKLYSNKSGAELGEVICLGGFWQTTDCTGFRGNSGWGNFQTVQEALKYVADGNEEQQEDK